MTSHRAAADERPTYLRGGLPCFIDRSRGYLVAATPEEGVRQDVLDWLVDDLKVPETRIRSEFHQRRRGGAGRADVIVLAPGADDGDGDVLMVVECKRPGLFLEDRTHEQAVRYADHLDASVIVLANGEERRAYLRAGTDQWKLLGKVPNWRNLVARKYVDAPEEAPFRRWAWDQISTPRAARAAAEEQDVDWLVGKDSPNELAPFAVDLFGLLADGHDGPRLPFRSGSVVVEKDLGQRSRTFGNHAGGAWSSDHYRSFLVSEDERSTFQVVSLIVYGNASVTNHPRWGNRRGRTMLVAAVDDGPKSHVSLEMTLDEAFDREVRTPLVELQHVGSMTVGKRGAVKREVVLSGLARLGAGDLVRGGRVVLGSLPRGRSLTWAEAMPFVGNVIRYALLRDRLRAELK